MLTSALVYLKQSSSTNSDIEKFISAGDVLLGLYTFNQTHGRGQYGNVWEGVPGQNLAYSLAIEKKYINVPNILINFHTASIIRNFLANMTNIDVKIKWPNDIIINNKKVSGMLIEDRKIRSRDFFVLGIGINVLQTDFDGLTKAGSIFTQTLKKVDLYDLSQSFHRFLIERFFDFGSREDIIERYQKHLFRKNVISVFEVNGLRQNGIIKKVDGNGFIWIDLEKDGMRKFFNKEIQLLY